MLADRPPRRLHPEAIGGLLLSTPYIAFLIVFSLLPIGAAFAMVFLKWDMVTPPAFAGLDNLRALVVDARFWQAVVNTLLFLAIHIPLQIVVALAYEAISEALVLGAKAGVDPTKIIEVLNGGLAATRVMEMRGATMIDHNFTPGFRLRLHHKDLGIALETAKAYGVPLPATALVDQIVGSLRAGGREDLDHSAILTYVEDLAHWQIGDPV